MLLSDSFGGTFEAFSAALEAFGAPFEAFDGEFEAFDGAFEAFEAMHQPCLRDWIQVISLVGKELADSSSTGH